MGVNSLPKTVTRQRRDCDLNPGPSESSKLTTRLPSDPQFDIETENSVNIPGCWATSSTTFFTNSTLGVVDVLLTAAPCSANTTAPPTVVPH